MTTQHNAESVNSILEDAKNAAFLAAEGLNKRLEDIHAEITALAKLDLLPQGVRDSYGRLDKAFQQERLQIITLLSRNKPSDRIAA